jgi:uncharacterized protein (TIGR00369 family)
MSDFPALSPARSAQVAEIFSRSAFTVDLGVQLSAVGPGWCETTLELQPRLLQQNGFVHAGVQATLADHTAGAAAATLLDDGFTVLSIEFKVNLLRPAVGARLRCRAQVLRGGRTISVVESEVYAVAGGRDKLCAKATVTLAVVPFPVSHKEQQ